MDAAGTKPLGSLVEEVEEDTGGRGGGTRRVGLCDRPPLPTVVPIPSFQGLVDHISSRSLTLAPIHPR